MSDKRKKRKFDAKRERLRLKRLAEGGRLKLRSDIPSGAVAADLSQQVTNNSYSPPPAFYVDMPFVCADCGSDETWTGEQQKWYYEVAKGSLYATAVRCDDCRRKHSEQKGRGDPRPIKHVGSLMKRIRAAIEPSLVKAEFKFDGKNRGSLSEAAYLDYSRPGMIVRFRFEPREARLIAETMDEETKCRVIANVELCAPDSTAALLAYVDEFTSSVRDFLQTLPAVP
jgi:hypothetical protein